MLTVVVAGDGVGGGNPVDDEGDDDGGARC